MAPGGSERVTVSVNLATTGRTLLADSGASRHICGDSAMLVPGSEEPVVVHVEGVHGQNETVKIQGTVLLRSNVDPGVTVPLLNTLILPSATRMLVSLAQLDREGYTFAGGQGQLTVSQSGAGVLLFEQEDGGANSRPPLYSMSSEQICVGNVPETGLEMANLAEAYKGILTPYELMHRRLGHVNYDVCRFIVDYEVARMAAEKGTKMRAKKAFHPPFCRCCAIAKATAAPVAGGAREASSDPTNAIAEVVLDWCGPFTESVDGYAGFLNIYVRNVDMSFAYPLRRRSDIPATFRVWSQHARALHGDKLHLVRTDNAPEFKSKAFKLMVEEWGGKLTHGAAYAHHHQSLVERSHRTLEEMARALRVQANLPKNMWSFAVRTAACIRQFLPSQADVRAARTAPAGSDRPPVPYERWYKRKYTNYTTILKNLRAFGCECVAHVPKELRHKDDNPGALAVYLGEATNQRAFTVMRLSDRKIMTCRHIIANETTFPFAREVQYPLQDGPIVAPDSMDSDLHSPTISATPPIEDGAPSKRMQPRGRGRKRGDVARFKQGEEVMTTQGRAIVHRVLADGDLELTWPDAVEPQAVYSVKADPELVWRVNDYPNYVYNSDGERVTKAVANVAIAEPWPTSQAAPPAARAAIADALLSKITQLTAEQVFGKMLADQVDLPQYMYQVRPSSPYYDLCMDACKTEWEGIKHAGAVSEPMECPPGAKSHMLNVILKCKSDSNGLATKVKARATLRGDLEKDIPKMAAYAPVTHPVTLRIMLALHLHDKDVKFVQYDIRAAYLTAPMKRDAYVRVPAYFDQRYKGKVAKLQKALYGGKDSGRTYFDYFTEFHINNLGFKAVHNDRCFLVLERDDGSFIKLAYHVDDVAVAHKGDALWEWYVLRMHEQFEFEVQPLSYFLGLNFEFGECPQSGARTCYVHQAQQIDKALRDLGMHNANFEHARTPTTNNTQPSLAELPTDPALAKSEMDAFPLQAAIAHLGWLYQNTRPDIGYPLKILSKFGSRHGTPMHKYCKQVLRYLRRTRRLGISMRGCPTPELQLFTDANHASDPDTRRSITSVVCKLGGNTIYWKNLFQTIVSHSSTESELMALDKGATLGQFIKWLTEAIGGTNVPTPIPIFVDNQGTIDISTNPVQPGRNLHVHARYFYVRDLVRDREYTIVKIGTDDQLADIQCVHKGAGTFEKLRQILMNCAHFRKHPIAGKYSWSVVAPMQVQ
jgi:hypothetical protein